MHGEPLKPQAKPNFARGALLAMALLLFWALADVVAVSVTRSADGPIGVGCVSGVLIGAQMAVLSLWTVFGPQRLAVRLTLATVLAPLAAGLSLALATALHPDFQPAWPILLGLPLLLLVSQVPLLGVRLLPGWRLTYSGEEQNRQPRQFHLQDLLVLTAAIAIALGLGQSGAVDPRDREVESNWGEAGLPMGVSAFTDAWLGIGCFCAVFVVKSRTTSCYILLGLLLTSCPLVLFLDPQGVYLNPLATAIPLGILFPSLLLGRAAGWRFPDSPRHRPPLPAGRHEMPEPSMQPIAEVTQPDLQEDRR